MSDLEDQLRAIAGRTADVDDHVTIHLAADELARLRAALAECAAPYDSGPTTVMGGAALLAAEFQRRMDIAGAALPPPPVKP